MSKMYFLPFRPAFDSAGVSVPGSQHWFTLAGTNTPSAPFTDATLTVPLTNPVIANGIGYLTPVYLNPSVSYRVRIYDADAEVGVDVPLEEYDPYVPALANSDVLADLADPSGYLLIGGLREKLTADRTYYVRTDGVDTNNGLANTAGGAFRNIQTAINTAYGLDLNGFEVTISVANGTYAEALLIYGPMVGVADSNAQPLKIVAQSAGLAIVSPASGTCLNIASRAYVLLDGLKWQAGAGNGWIIKGYATVEHRNCTFNSFSGDMMIVQEHCYVKALGPLNVSGNASSFCHCTVKSHVKFTDQTITFNGNAFGTYLWGINDGTVALDGAILAGSRPTGSTTVHDFGFLNTYSMTNAVGWGFLGVGSYTVEDSSIVAADAYVARTCYVRSDATSDQNDGGENTVGRAFKTIQGALNFLAKFPRNSANSPPGSGVKIKVADGTYSQTLTLRDVPYFDATIEGNLATPANVVIAGTTDGVIATGLQTVWNLNGVKLNATSGSGLRAEKGSVVTFGPVEFGSASASQITASTGAVVTATANYTVTSSAAMHYQVLLGARIDVSGRTVTLTGANNYTSGFARVWSNSTLNVEGATFNPTPVPTAVKYDIRSNGAIWTNGSGVTLPGASAGTTATGGQYA